MTSEEQPGAVGAALRRAEEIYASLPPLQALVVAIPFVDAGLPLDAVHRRTPGLDRHAKQQSR